MRGKDNMDNSETTAIREFVSEERLEAIMLSLPPRKVIKMKPIEIRGYNDIYDENMDKVLVNRGDKIIINNKRGKAVHVKHDFRTGEGVIAAIEVNFGAGDYRNFYIGKSWVKTEGEYLR
jgi:hypothetical protein